MTTDQIADAINRHRLHLRKDGQPVTSKQVYATICRFPETVSYTHLDVYKRQTMPRSSVEPLTLNIRPKEGLE